MLVDAVRKAFKVALSNVSLRARVAELNEGFSTEALYFMTPEEFEAHLPNVLLHCLGHTDAADRDPVPLNNIARLFGNDDLAITSALTAEQRKAAARVLALYVEETEDARHRRDQIAALRTTLRQHLEPVDIRSLNASVPEFQADPL